jgi:hypothetical protein
VWKIRQGPGPGTYKELSTRPDGIYPVSTFLRTKSPKYSHRINPNPTSSNYDRIPNLGKEAPGPGHYNIASVLISQSFNMRSPKSVTSAVTAFGLEKRKVFMSTSSKLILF